MGTIMESIFGSVLKKAELAARKLGKTREQKKVIDFFMKDSGGCGGCLSKITGISMEDYLELVQKKANVVDYRKRAISKIGLDESEIREIEPLTFSSFVYDKDCDIKVDAVAVSNRYAVSWIFFSSTQIYTYRYIFDMTSDDSWEFTKDFFYKDITSFQTEHDVKEHISVGGCLKFKANATKCNYVVDTLQIIVPNDVFSFSMTNSPEMEKSVQAAKAMLREKKFN